MGFKIAITISFANNQFQYGSGIYFQAGYAEIQKMSHPVE